jgi:hypothetical protein
VRRQRAEGGAAELTAAHRYLRAVLDKGKALNLSAALRSTIITKGFEYALGTGNWGVQTGGPTPKVGVRCVGAGRAGQGAG